MLQNTRSYPDLDGPGVRAWLGPVLADLAPAARSLGVRFNGVRAMSRMNRQYRGKQGPTDVLSFPADGAPGHLGDVVVCVPVARRQAAVRRHPLAREVRLLLLHGMIHCAGYDHETDAGEMVTLERRLRRRWLDLP